MSRPEHQAPPEIYYNEITAAKYTENSHIGQIQASLADRALELILLPPDEKCLILDIGCGSCLASDRISEAGHDWIGVDISAAMLDVARKRSVENDLILADIGQDLRFHRPGLFDGAISISTIQWLCNADKKSHNPYKRLLCFFKWLYNSLARGARAALQFYPENSEQTEMINSAALRSGFGGGLVVDFPHSTRAKKFFLVIWAGYSNIPPSLPQGLTGDDDTQIHVGDRKKIRNKRTKDTKKVKGRSWILHKKQSQREKGKIVRPDTKYTGRKRKDRF